MSEVTILLEIDGESACRWGKFTTITVFERKLHELVLEGMRGQGQGRIVH